MQKPNSIFDKKPETFVAPPGKTEPVSNPAHTPAVHAEKHDAQTETKQAQKK
jgi:hypothetical protein